MRRPVGCRFGCLSLFGLPFLVFGLLMTWAAVGSFLDGAPRHPGLRMFLGLGLIFSTCGGGLVFGPLVWRGHVLREDRERRAGRMPPVYAQPLYVPLVFGLAWNVFIAGFALAWVESLPLLLPFIAVGGVTSVWLGRELRLRRAFGRFRLRVAEPPRAGERVDWRLEGPRDRLRAPTFELAFRDEELVEKGENNHRWEGRDVRSTALEAVDVPQGWEGRFQLREAPLRPIETDRVRRRWVIRVRDGRREACFPLPNG